MNRYSYIVLTIGMLVLHGVAVPSTAQKKNEKQKIRIDLSYHQRNDELPVLQVGGKTKNGKRFEPVEGVIINLFFLEETAQGFMGLVKTNNKGIASLPMPAKFKPAWDTLSTFTFLATVTSNELFEDESTEIEITKAKIELTLAEADSTRTIHAKLLAAEDSSWVVVPETDIKLVVKRLQSDLPAGDEESYTTDEAGEVSTEFNLAIPGDVNGDITIGAKTEDHELYGNIAVTKRARWGMPAEPDKSFAKRTLFATRDKTPLWLLVFPNLIIATVWGFIIYLIYLIFQIRRIGKTNKTA